MVWQDQCPPIRLRFALDGRDHFLIFFASFPRGLWALGSYLWYTSYYVDTLIVSLFQQSHPFTVEERVDKGWPGEIVYSQVHLR